MLFVSQAHSNFLFLDFNDFARTGPILLAKGFLGEHDFLALNELVQLVVLHLRLLATFVD